MKEFTSPPWSVPVTVDEVPPEGRHLALAADAAARTAVAKLAGVSSISRLGAEFDITRHGADGLHVAGQVSATVGQTCVVTLEPIESDVVEAIDLTFVAGEPPRSAANDRAGETDDELPEPLAGGAVDLGAIATEFLLLGIDPYPRKPDAVFVPPAREEHADNPFAALAALKKRSPDR
jgi:uncharacterized metal-binding protein YceD (DUF177 family)